MRLVWFKNLFHRPILLCLLGWSLFPGMYLSLGILTALKVEPSFAIIIVSPIGILGFVCWILSFFVSFRKTVWQQSKGQAVFGMLLSGLPLALLIFGYIFVIGSGGV